MWAAPSMRRVLAASEAGLVLTHFYGAPKLRPRVFPDVDVVSAVADWARATIADAGAAGIAPERIVVDPGVGLGKSPQQDLDLLRRIDEVVAVGRPVFVPISNKKVIGAVTGADAPDRLSGTAAGMVWARSRGATLFRVHEVGFLRQALEMADALADGEPARWHEVVK